MLADSLGAKTADSPMPRQQVLWHEDGRISGMRRFPSAWTAKSLLSRMDALWHQDSRFSGAQTARSQTPRTQLAIKSNARQNRVAISPYSECYSLATRICFMGTGESAVMAPKIANIMRPLQSTSDHFKPKFQTTSNHFRPTFQTNSDHFKPLKTTSQYHFEPAQTISDHFRVKHHTISDHLPPKETCA